MIRLNPNRSIAEFVKSGVKNNAGYCPCKTEQIAENKCMCEDFKKQDSGECYCGLYVKE